MKIVCYDNNKKFEITDREFNEAIVCWNNKNPYFCQRLGALLTKIFKYVETKDKIFIKNKILNNGQILKLKYLKSPDGDYFRITEYLPIKEDFLNEEEKKQFEREIISEDNILDNYNSKQLT